MDDTRGLGRAALYTPPFLALCAVAFLGFAQNFVLQPILPLLVLDLGGDAAVVGVTLAVFSIPSIVMRPVIGRLADRWGQERILLAGTIGTGLVTLVYLVPSLATLIGARVLHGICWASFTTGSTSTLARIAPSMRRLEASGVFDLMPSLAALVMPSAALLLLRSAGFPGPLLLASALGLGAALVTLVAFRPWRSRADGATPARRGGPWLEPSALAPMVMVLLFTSASSLFLVYPPLLAQDLGIAITDLVLYYPIYGLTLALSRASTGRIFERRSRASLLAASAVIAAIGLVIGAAADSLAVLTVAASVFAVAYGIAPPAAQAVVMERAPRDRLGAAMATYTLGFQMGSGLGAAAWGFLLAPLGFGRVFLIAAGIQVALFALALRRRADWDAEPASA